MSLFQNNKKSQGVHPPSYKITKQKPTEKAPLPTTVTIPLSQHIGAPAKPLVKKGDQVKTGQKIADLGGFCSAAIHAPVSGTVTKIIPMVSSVNSKIIQAIVIESDGNDEWIELDKPEHPEKLTREELINKIKEAGIVGMGGATFPTHIKLQPPADKPIDNIIVNGCECEPFITTDHRLMIENADEMLKGLSLSMTILNCNRAYIGIEDNKPDAILHLRKRIDNLSLPGTITVEELPAQYPMGAEKTLLKRIHGNEVKIGGLPMDVGVVVHNVATLKAMYDAIYEGKPLIERTVTVTGEVKDPKNLLTRLGTPADILIEHCGGSINQADTVIFGGPMMGIAQLSDSSPIQKGTNCVLLQHNEKSEEGNCIRCGRCVDACPMNLMPMNYVAYVKKKLWEDLPQFYITNCVECGSCSYSCPAHIPIVQYIKTGKAELAKLGVKQ